MNASNPETIYSVGSGDWTQARLITVSDSARTVPMSHRDKQHNIEKVGDASRSRSSSGGPAVEWVNAVADSSNWSRGHSTWRRLGLLAAAAGSDSVKY